MKTTRRKVLKVLGTAAVGLTLAPLIGCERTLDEIAGIITSNSQNEANAVNLIRRFCDANLYGTAHTSGHILFKPQRGFDPAWDFISVVDNYKIISSKPIDNLVQIYVEFDYVGVHKGDYFYFHNYGNNNRKITTKYIVKDGIMTNGRTSFTQTDIYKLHLEKLLNSAKNCANCPDISEIMKSHYIQTSERYTQILANL